MAEETNNSLVHIDLSKPADTLIKKVSNAVGGIFAPYQIKRMAKAEAEAALIKAGTEIQITELHHRAMHRFIREEGKRQENIEQITAKALPQLEERADANKIEDDWITNFFDKARIISDDDMQGLWSRVLAGEANAPGTYSKRTVNFLGDLDKSDAEMFSKLCGFGWVVGGVVPLVFEKQGDIYEKNGVNFSTLTHLESIGLIQFNSLSGFRRIGLPKNFVVYYYGQPTTLELQKDSDNDLSIGHVLLTRTGMELAPICGSVPVDGFVDYIKERWKSFLPKSAEQDGPGDAERPRG